MQYTSLTPELRRYFDRLSAAAGLRFAPDPETPVIEVDEAVRSIAGFYERTRNTLEYGEGDFLRQRAIVRALRRLVHFRPSLPIQEQALECIRELIRGGYFPNATIPEIVSRQIAEALERLFAAYPVVDPLFHDELLRFAVFDVEDAVYPERAAAHAATIHFVVEVALSRMRWPREATREPGHQAFLFVAAHRAVLNADRARILYAFLRDAFPAWRTASGEEMASLAPQFERVLAIAKRTVVHPRCEQYTRAMRRIAPAFRAVDDAVTSATFAGQSPDAVSILQVERRIDEAVAARYQSVKQRLRKTAWRATLYVFFTKMVVAFLIELPYEFYVSRSFVPDVFMVNLLFPPALMFFVAFSARPPRQEVAERIIDDAMKIIASTQALGHVRFPRKRGTARLLMFMVSVGTMTGGAIYFILKGLAALGFGPLAMLVFLMFFSIVSLFAWRIRKPLRELAAGSGDGGVLYAALEILVFPFLAVGRFLSDGIRSVNVFVFLLDVFIESPLKVLFAAGEDWLAFLREKREQLVEE